MATTSATAPRRGPGLARWLIVAVFAAALYVGWRLLWHMADDAYITFRHITQFLAGNGLTFNTLERVEGFTHPLWALLLVAAAAEPARDGLAQLQVTSSVAGASVSIDDRLMGLAPRTEWLTPGALLVRV